MVSTNYIATSCGKIVGPSGHVLKPYDNGCGYSVVALSYGSRSSRRKVLVHRYVWSYFNGEIPTGMQIDHINNDRSDNRIDNLQLLSQTDNIRKSCCKLSEEQVIELRSLLKTHSLRGIAKMFNISPKTVLNIKSGKQYNHVH